MNPRSLASDGLRVAIGFPSAVMLVTGGMVGVGIYVNPAVVARSLHSPTWVIIAWGLGGAVAVLGALVYAELAARIPATGGEYAYLRETFGPLAGFLFGWTTLLVVQAGGMAAVAIVFAKNVRVLIGDGAPESLTVIVVLAALAGINCLGVISGNKVQGWLGVIKFTAIAGLVGVGLFISPHVVDPPSSPDQPLGAQTLKTFGAAMIPVVFSYGGWQTAAYVAGEVNDPRRNLGRALLTGVFCVIVVYLLVNVACLNALGVLALGRTLTPTSDVLKAVSGRAGSNLAAAIIALSAMAYLSQSMLTGPRVYFAMARDGLFFRQAAQVAHATRAPVIAILLQAAWGGVLALSGSYEQILSYVVAMNFLFFFACATCLFVLRRREARGITTMPPGGFRTPFHPWSTGLFLLVCLLMVASTFWAYPVNSLIGYAIMFLGVPPYLFWRRQSSRETRPR